MEPKEQRKVDEFIVYAMCAATPGARGFRLEADDATTSRSRTGVMIGSGIGGIEGIAETAITLKERGPRRVSPFFIPGPHHQSRLRLCVDRVRPEGPELTRSSPPARPARTRSATPARLIALGDADVMVAGGTESPVNRLSIAGFAACRALSTGFNDTPTKASRPYDKDRDGFVMGEGAGVVVLEEYEHAKARGAKIYAELVGYGLSGDAFHITAPSEDGDGAFRCMSAAIKRAGITPADIDYINAHGTSTMADTIELGAVRARGRQRGRQDLDVLDQVLRSATCSARPAPSRRSSRFSRSATASRRRPSISTIPRSRRRSISCRTRRASATSTWCCRIRSASAAPTRRWSSAALLRRLAMGTVHPFAIFGLNLRQTAREWT